MPDLETLLHAMILAREGAGEDEERARAAVLAVADGEDDAPASTQKGVNAWVLKEWQNKPAEGRKNPSPNRWVNTETGAIKYSKEKPGTNRHAKKETQQTHASTLVSDIKAGKHTDADTLIASMQTLTKDQIRGIRDQLDLAGHGRKGELAKQLAQQVISGKRTERKKPVKVSPESKPITPGKVYNIPPENLKVDPSRFQYKLNTDKSGVTAELKEVKTWNPDFAGVVSVWRDPADGKTYVVNGHHRHELASRLGVKDLAVRYVEAKDAREARAIGALVNIAEGRGTAIDAAKFMRDSGAGPAELAERGVSLKGKVSADAAALTRLSDRTFDRLARGLLDEGRALAVAKHLGDHARQDALFSLLEKREESGKDLSNKVVEEMAREMAATPTTTTTERTLFGDIESEESLFIPRNELKNHIRNELAREVNDWLAVASKRRAGRVGEAGNVLDTEKNREIADAAEEAKYTYDTLVNSKGVISDAINQGAEEYAKARTRSERDAVKKRTLEAVPDAILREDGGAVEPGGTGPGSEPGAQASGDERGGTSPEVPADGGGGDSEPAGLTPPEVGFTGVDANGHHWVNGVQVAKPEEGRHISVAAPHAGQRITRATINGRRIDGDLAYIASRIQEARKAKP